MHEVPHLVSYAPKVPVTQCRGNLEEMWNDGCRHSNPITSTELPWPTRLFPALRTSFAIIICSIFSYPTQAQKTIKAAESQSSLQILAHDCHPPIPT
jgi:hypothetical protein